jgi:WD40 repeat protein
MDVSPSVSSNNSHVWYSSIITFQQFILRSTLNRHTSSITHMCINPDGRTLTSCGNYLHPPWLMKRLIKLALGDDALVVLWDLETGAQLQDISCPFNGPITVAVWLPAAQGTATAFAFACADGSIHIYVQHPCQVSLLINVAAQLIFAYDQENYTFSSFTSAHRGPVEDLAFELTRHRLASVGHGSLQVWELKSNCERSIILDDFTKTNFSRYAHATSSID